MHIPSAILKCCFEIITLDITLAVTTAIIRPNNAL